MFCSNCGKELPDDAKFCPGCGAKVKVNVGEDRTEDTSNFSDAADDITDAVKDAAGVVFETFASAEKELEKATKDVIASFQGDDGDILQSDRSLFKYIVLSIITCSIYSWYFIYKMAHDVNIACDGDGEATSGLVAFVILSMVTCGLYGIWWEYKLANRLAANAPKYDMYFPEAGGAVLLWNFVGVWACGIGPFIAMHILIKNSNKICHAYNVQHGFED